MTLQRKLFGAGLGLVGAGILLLGFVSWRPLSMYGGPRFEPQSLTFSIILMVTGLILLAAALRR